MPKETKEEMIHSVALKALERYTYATLIGSGRIYSYDPSCGVYVNDAESRVKLFVETALQERATMHVRSEVLEKIRCRTMIDVGRFDSDDSSVCLLNGILDLRSRKLRPHSPDELFMRQLSVTYDPHSTCPAIKRFLSEVVTDADATRLQQFAGFMLQSGYRHHKAFILVGHGGNGKTTFSNLLQSFIGAGHFSSLSLQQISHEKFLIPRLLGKIANISPEMGSSTIKDTEMLKVVTGESSFEAQEKNEKAFNMTNSAKMIFACNEIPAAPGADDAYYQRWMIIPFPNTFEPGKTADENLLEKLTDPCELSGFLNFALDGLDSLERSRHFDYPLNATGCRTIYQAWSGDTIQQFVAVMLVMDDDAEIASQALMSAYIDYCRSIDKVPESENKFFTDLPKAVGGRMVKVRTRDGETRIPSIRGIRLATLDDKTVPYKPTTIGGWSFR